MKAAEFRSLKEMKQNVRNLNEVCAIVGFELHSDEIEREKTLKKLFTKI